ncbi:MAG: CHAP domain-containing protein [Myxococcaceae bacterium]
MPLSKETLLIHEAKRWVSITEQGGNNRGQLVTLFQRAAGGLANGEPWCMAFVQFCIQAVDTLVADCEGSTQKSLLFKSEHCLCIWQQGQTASGHVGIIVDVNADGSIMTVEGNTSSGDAGNQREGDGVWLKRRCLGANASLKLKGFLRVW